ncbi:UNVERIFIED_CONTAM: hypothetical protein Sindi_1453600, partial [Sesamum indicum]
GTTIMLDCISTRMDLHSTGSTMDVFMLARYTYTVQSSTENLHEFRVYAPSNGDPYPFESETSPRCLLGAADRGVADLWYVGVLTRDNAN